MKLETNPPGLPRAQAVGRVAKNSPRDFKVAVLELAVSCRALGKRPAGEGDQESAHKKPRLLLHRESVARAPSLLLHLERV
jgi:hypothetical protein